MQDLCHAARYIRMSSNPTGGCLIIFSTFTFWGCIFSCAFYNFCVLFVCFDFLCFCCCIVLYCIVFVINITMKFQDASCPSLAVGVLVIS